MDKRYQVFVSSTSENLVDERLEVMKALLELDCVPCGMEYFPAANEDQWTVIKDLIDKCDYYVVIIPKLNPRLRPGVWTHFLLNTRLIRLYNWRHDNPIPFGI